MPSSSMTDWHVICDVWPWPAKYPETGVLLIQVCTAAVGSKFAM